MLVCTYPEGVLAGFGVTSVGLELLFIGGGKKKSQQKKTSTKNPKPLLHCVSNSSTYLAGLGSNGLADFE